MKKKNSTEVDKGGNNSPPSPLGRHRSWVFTSFDEQPPIFDTEEMKYLLYAPEITPTTKKAHWQGFVVWKWAKTFNSTRKVFSNYCAIMEGSFKDQLDYIRGPYKGKDGKEKPFNSEWKEFGTPPKQGERSDIIAIKNEIMEGRKVDDICLENPEFFHQYGRTLSKIEDLSMRKKWRTEMTEGFWYFGKTSVGKSHKAFEDYSPDTHYNVPDDKGWWDAYCQQDTVILNDFRGEIPYNNLLQLVDKWPHSVNRRNREPMPFISKKVIITSSLHPCDVYRNRNERDSIEQLLRRFTIIELK